MNKVFLIGNGFDLAHNLKTRYSDFLVWYINKIVGLYNNDDLKKHTLLTLDGGGNRLNEFDSLDSFHAKLKKGQVTFESKFAFVKSIIGKSTDSNWVDIEYEYYSLLLGTYSTIDKYNIGATSGEYFVKELNNCFELIKEQLIEYLQTLKIATYNEQIEILLNNELKQHSFNKVLFLVFNYTKTIELYINSLHIINSQVIYIHGQLGEDRNPIIFGYGDEMDENYSGIESLNLNEFLRNMKSFSYLKTNNYQNLNRFINLGDFTLSIMGHSCGISDRVLLSSIFNHQNCRQIRIYYYKKNGNENDFFEKTQEISRHFPLSQKNKMRTKIVPFQDSFPLVD